MYIRVIDWPFKSIQNSLNLVFEADASENIQSCNIEAQTDGSNSLQSFVISIGGSSLYPVNLFILLTLLYLYHKLLLTYKVWSVYCPLNS